MTVRRNAWLPKRQAVPGAEFVVQVTRWGRLGEQSTMLSVRQLSVGHAFVAPNRKHTMRLGLAEVVFQLEGNFLGDAAEFPGSQASLPGVFRASLPGLPAPQSRTMPHRGVHCWLIAL